HPWRRRVLYRSYRRLHTLGDWWHLKLTSAGRFLAWILLISACLGIDTLRSMVFQLFSLSAGLFMVSALLSLKKPPRLSVTRTLPEFATAGSELTYRIHVTNTSGKNLSGLQIRERFSDPRPGLDEFIREREPHEHLRNAWDRRLKVQRWSWLIHRGMNARSETLPVPELRAGCSADIPGRLLPLHRGSIRLDGFTLLAPEPLGITCSFRHIACDASILVLPRRYRVFDPVLPGSRKHHKGGITLTSRVGDSHEFISLRDYRSGDPMRQIHWKSWAKTGRLIVRETQDEYFSRHALILDTLSPSPENQEFETAVSLAASFVTQIRTGEAILDLMFAGSRVYRISAGRHLGSPKTLLETLAFIRPGTGDEFPGLAQAVLDQASRLSGCIAILTRADEQRLDLIKRLRRSGVPVIALVIAARDLDIREPGLHVIRTDAVEQCLDSLQSEFSGHGHPD
ncbi:MAG: DUF58 domain-containing protein, partial [Pseudomonadota bacterium]